MKEPVPISSLLDLRSNASAPPGEKEKSSAIERISALVAEANVPLDSLLPQIADETRLLTGARGVAVALSNGAEMSCRATSGERWTRVQV